MRAASAWTRASRCTFQAPHSYTGEAVLELQGHGGPVVMQAVLARRARRRRAPRRAGRIHPPGLSQRQARSGAGRGGGRPDRRGEPRGGALGAALARRGILGGDPGAGRRSSPSCARSPRRCSIFRKKRSTACTASDARRAAGAAARGARGRAGEEPPGQPAAQRHPRGARRAAECRQIEPAQPAGGRRARHRHARCRAPRAMRCAKRSRSKACRSWWWTRPDCASRATKSSGSAWNARAARWSAPTWCWWCWRPASWKRRQDRCPRRGARITVVNKIDLVPGAAAGRHGEAIHVSAKTGAGLDALRAGAARSGGLERARRNGVPRPRTAPARARTTRAGICEAAAAQDAQWEFFAEELRLAQEALGDDHRARQRRRSAGGNLRALLHRKMKPHGSTILLEIKGNISRRRRCFRA